MDSLLAALDSLPATIRSHLSSLGLTSQSAPPERWLRIVAIVGGYILLRQWLMRWAGAKQAADAQGLTVPTNVEGEGVEDGSAEAETTGRAAGGGGAAGGGAGGADWGGAARERKNRSRGDHTESIVDGDGGRNGTATDQAQAQAQAQARAQAQAMATAKDPERYARLRRAKEREAHLKGQRAWDDEDGWIAGMMAAKEVPHYDDE